MNKGNRYLKLFLSFSILFGLAGCSRGTADTNAAKTKSSETLKPTEEAVNKNSYAYEISQDPNYSPYQPGETDLTCVKYGDGTEYPYVPRHFDNGIGKTAYDLNTDGLTLWDRGREQFHITDSLDIQVKELKGPFKIIATNKDTGEQTLMLGMESNGFLKGVRGDWITVYVPEPADYNIDPYISADTIGEHSVLTIEYMFAH